MGRHRPFTISESLKELASFKHKVTDYKSSQRLQVLLLIKSEKYNNLNASASNLGVHYAILKRWLKRYREQGLENLLLPLTRTASQR